MNKEAEQLVRRVRQLPGWQVRQVRSGWLCLPPNPAQRAVVIHRSPSDRRFRRNALSDLRRAGAEV